MIEFKCDTGTMIPFANLEPFQGRLKNRGKEDVKRLATSLEKDGLLMPFVVWERNGNRDGMYYLLDGHARYEAVKYLEETEREFPAIKIEASTLEDAKRYLLQITADYGKMTVRGLEGFISGTRINLKEIGMQVKHRVKTDKIDVQKVALPKTDRVKIVIQVAHSEAERIVGLLKQYSCMEILDIK